MEGRAWPNLAVSRLPARLFEALWFANRCCGSPVWQAPLQLSGPSCPRRALTLADAKTNLLRRYSEQQATCTHGERQPAELLRAASLLGDVVRSHVAVLLARVRHAGHAGYAGWQPEQDVASHTGWCSETSGRLGLSPNLVHLRPAVHRQRYAAADAGKCEPRWRLLPMGVWGGLVAPWPASLALGGQWQPWAAVVRHCPRAPATHPTPPLSPARPTPQVGVNVPLLVTSFGASSLVAGLAGQGLLRNLVAGVMLVRGRAPGGCGIAVALPAPAQRRPAAPSWAATPPAASHAGLPLTAGHVLPCLSLPCPFCSTQLSDR